MKCRMIYSFIFVSIIFCYSQSKSMLTTEPRVTRNPLALRIPVTNNITICPHDGTPVIGDSSSITKTCLGLSVVMHFTCPQCNRIYVIHACPICGVYTDTITTR